MATSIQSPKAPPRSKSEDPTFREAVRALIGKRVTVVTAESYEKAPVGHHLRPGFLPATVHGLGRDYVLLVTEDRSGGKAKQLVPLANIKRISLMPKEVVLHL